MDFDDLLYRYFGTAEIAEIGPHLRAAGVERLLVDLGMEKDRSKRFALWAVLHMMDAAPDLDAVFALEEDRNAARNLMDLLAAAQQG